MTTNFRRTFGDAASPLPLSYLDENFNQLENTSTSTVTLAGAALVGYIASGSGATSSNVQTELRRVLRPEHFGAAADNTTDDAAAFAAANVVATANSTGGEIRLTAGKQYRIKTNVTLDSDVTLWFEDGARLNIDNGVTFTAPGAVISFGGVPYTGSGTFTADFGCVMLTAGGSLGVGTTNPNVHAGDDGTTTRVISVMARTAPLFIGITDRTPTAGNTIVSFEGYDTEQTAPHDELIAIRGVFEGATAGQVGGAIHFLTKIDGSTSMLPRVVIHDHGDVLFGTTADGAVASANRVGQTSGTTGVRVVTICGATEDGVVELATNKADADALAAGQLLFISNQNTAGEKRVAGIQAVTNGSTATNRGGDLVFYTKTDGSTFQERGRFNEDGFLKVSRNNGSYISNAGLYHEMRSNQGASYIADLSHSHSSQPLGLQINFSGAAPDDNTQWFLKCLDSTPQTRLQIFSDGDVQNHDNSYGALSDERLKQDIVDAGSQWDDIKNLRVRKYRLKADVAAGKDHVQLGVIAQEVQPISPGLVVHDKTDDVFAVQYSVLYMKAVKALQEAMARIENLEEQVKAMQ